MKYAFQYAQQHGAHAARLARPPLRPQLGAPATAARLRAFGAGLGRGFLDASVAHFAAGALLGNALIWPAEALLGSRIHRRGDDGLLCAGLDLATVGAGIAAYRLGTALGALVTPLQPRVWRAARDDLQSRGDAARAGGRPPPPQRGLPRARRQARQLRERPARRLQRLTVVGLVALSTPLRAGLLAAELGARIAVVAVGLAVALLAVPLALVQGVQQGARAQQLARAAAARAVAAAGSPAVIAAFAARHGRPPAAHEAGAALSAYEAHHGMHLRRCVEAGARTGATQRPATLPRPDQPAAAARG